MTSPRALRLRFAVRNAHLHPGPARSDARRADAPRRSRQKPPVVAGPRPVAKVYAEFCASCHGPTLDGGQAPTLLDDTWTFGSDDASLAQTIRDGRPPTPMPSFKAALSEQEIRALVIFIREEHAKARVTRATAKPPAPIGGMVVESQLQTFKLEVVAEGLDTPWGIALAARRQHAGDRAHRPRPPHRQGRHAVGADRGRAAGVGEAGRRPDGHRRPPEVRDRTATTGSTSRSASRERSPSRRRRESSARGSKQRPEHPESGPDRHRASG